MNNIKLYKKLGSALCQTGQQFLRKAFNVQTIKMSKQQVNLFLLSVGIENVRLPDEYYYLTNLDAMTDIIHFDWTDKKKWIQDYSDCDNMAHIFAGHTMEIFDLNSVGILKGIELKNLDTDKHIGWHRANLLLTQTKGLTEAYLFEPMNDKLIKIEKNKTLILGKWKYILNSVEMN